MGSYDCPVGVWTQPLHGLWTYHGRLTLGFLPAAGYLDPTERSELGRISIERASLRSFMESGPATQTVFRPPNVFQAKLRGRDRATARIVARRLPRIPLDSDARSAADVTPRRWCSAQGLQPRTEAGPRQLQLGVRRRFRTAPHRHRRMMAVQLAEDAR
jgi:hypothetical protein